MSKQITTEDIIEHLKGMTLFSSVNEEDLEKLALLLTVEHFSSGENVITEDEENGDSLYIIINGVVDILKKTRHGDEYVVTELNADMPISFGELALLDPDKRSATVHCKSECKFLKLTRKDFLKFGDENPISGLAITRELSTMVCKRNRKANTDILTLFDALVEEVEISGGIS